MSSATLEGEGVVLVKKHTTPLGKRMAKQTVSVALVAITTTKKKSANRVQVGHFIVFYN